MNNLDGLIQKENLAVLGTIIKINRIQQNMSQQALSEGICVPSYLSKIENGEVVPSLEVIRLIFEELNIEYTDEYQFMKEMKEKLTSFFYELNLNGFIKSKEIFKRLEQNESKLVNSPLIIDYYLAKLAFYCGTKDQEQFLKAKNTIQLVEEVLSNQQKHSFYFYEAINRFVKERNYSKSKEYLMLAKNYLETGHLYYFLANVEYKLGSYYGAVIYIEKALKFYQDEVNIINISQSHQFQGLLIYELGTKDLYEEYFEKAISYAKKINRNDMELSALTLYLYIQMKEHKSNSKDLFYRINEILSVEKTLFGYENTVKLLALINNNEIEDLEKVQKLLVSKIENKFYESLITIFGNLSLTKNMDKEALEDLVNYYTQYEHPTLLFDLILNDLTIGYFERNRMYKQAYMHKKR